jgi:hypothetical protein
MKKRILVVAHEADVVETIPITLELANKGLPRKQNPNRLTDRNSGLGYSFCKRATHYLNKRAAL